jgi:predicted permease
MAVVVLSFFQPDSHGIDKAVLKKTLRGIVTNPIILGIVAGLLWSALSLPMPTILQKTVTNLGSISSPLGLMAMGATFDFKKALGKVKPAVVAAVIKLMGFRKEELVAILVMLGSATTVSSYVMARNMGHEGVLSSSTVMLTTLFSAFTLTFWLWLLRSLGYV